MNSSSTGECLDLAFEIKRRKLDWRAWHKDKEPLLAQTIAREWRKWLFIGDKQTYGNRKCGNGKYLLLFPAIHVDVCL